MILNGQRQKRVIFGNGDILVDVNTKINEGNETIEGLLLIDELDRNHEIGSNVGTYKDDSTAQVVLSFKNVESLDVVIKKLLSLREKMFLDCDMICDISDCEGCQEDTLTVENDNKEVKSEMEQEKEIKGEDILKEAKVISENVAKQLEEDGIMGMEISLEDLEKNEALDKMFSKLGISVEDFKKLINILEDADALKKETSQQNFKSKEELAQYLKQLGIEVKCENECENENYDRQQIAEESLKDFFRALVGQQTK